MRENLRPIGGTGLARLPAVSYGWAVMTGEQLRTAREAAGWRQQDLADAVGVSLKTVGNWERGAGVSPWKEREVRAALEAAASGDQATQVPSPSGRADDLDVVYILGPTATETMLQEVTEQLSEIHLLAQIKTGELHDLKSREEQLRVWRERLQERKATLTRAAAAASRLEGRDGGFTLAAKDVPAGTDVAGEDPNPSA